MNTELMEALNVLEKEKNIRKEVVLKAIEESLVQACKHHFGKSDNIVVNMDYNTGEYEINMAKEVVENVEDQQTQISLPNAKILDKRAVYGSTVYVKVNSKEFGRIAAQIAKAIILQKLREEENRAVYERYKLMERDLVSGVISRHFERRGEDGKSTTVNVSVNLGKAEATLMAGEQIKGEEYKVNTRMKFYVVEVKDLPKGPKILLSRSRPELVKRLFEAEFAEIKDGTVEIKAISREAGSRTKMAVCSHDENVDAVGACVGVKGSRVHGIVRELCNENLDVINYSSNTKLFIQRALAPAKVSSINVDDENKKAEVYLQPEEVSLAIGRGGMNIKLASMLTEYTIDVFREVDENEADEDIYLDEFSDEIDQWVIDAIKGIGLDTAKQVLNAPRNLLIEKADLEEETVDHVLSVLRAEFEQ